MVLRLGSSQSQGQYEKQFCAGQIGSNHLEVVHASSASQMCTLSDRLRIRNALEACNASELSMHTAPVAASVERHDQTLPPVYCRCTACHDQQEQPDLAIGYMMLLASPCFLSLHMPETLLAYVMSFRVDIISCIPCSLTGKSCIWHAVTTCARVASGWRLPLLTGIILQMCQLMLAAPRVCQCNVVVAFTHCNNSALCKPADAQGSQYMSQACISLYLFWQT